MPSTRERHDLIFNTARTSGMATSSLAMWVGMSDVTTEGTWEFVDGSKVNSAPAFGGAGIICFSFKHNRRCPVLVCTFHDGCKQEIDQQIFDRKSMSRKITHPHSLFK